MDDNAYRVVKLQAIVAIASATAAYFLVDTLAAVSVFWGGLGSLANGVLLAYRAREKALDRDLRVHLRALYRSSLERFFVAILFLAAGMKLLPLKPLSVLFGFVACQLALIFARLLLKKV